MPKLPMGDIGPCIVIWDYEGTNPSYLNPYLGTVELSWVDSVSDVQQEGMGDAPVDGVFAGSVVELSVPMARSVLHRLKDTIGYGEMGALSYKNRDIPTDPATADDYTLTLCNMSACDMYENAKQMVVAPMCNNIIDPDEHSWILLFKCHPYRDFTLTYDRSGQRVHMVKFKVFPNQDSGYCGEYGQWGDVYWRLCYRDDFDDAAIGSEWTTHNTDANRTVEEAGEVVTISIASDIDGRWTWVTNEAPKLYQDVFSVPFEAIVKINSFTLNDKLMAGMWIGYYDAIFGGNEAWKLILHRSDGVGEGMQTLMIPAGGGDWDFNVTSADLPFWMKIAVDDSEVITFYYSKDKITWVQMKQAGAPMEISGWFASDMQIGLTACSDDPTPHGAIAAPFEYFEIYAYC